MMSFPPLYSIRLASPSALSIRQVGPIVTYLSTKLNQNNLSHTQSSVGDVLEDDPVGRLKVFVYELPSKYNKKILQKDLRCLNHMFAAEIIMHRFLLSSPVRTLNPEEADWFYTLVYATCDLIPNGLPLPFKSPRMMRSVIQLISSNWPYWNCTKGADHFFVVPHDFGACFHYQAIERGILELLRHATLVQRLLANPSMKQAMLFPQPAQPGNAFHQVLNGLARKLPHDNIVFLKPREKILNWTVGP
ncbi:hypothetical protein VIGAN_03140700 [Vigna angularis var. angularis]|uniref:Exostosin GT47 domain-containing protein n=1 Tax=Vigna angularis var. angularis TaxID=157739 RepID=A0A0S3RM52_PHAAN|nr:hypothetical protein VIGAN_03140700 [Vigna angularis var. angularis]